MPIESVEPIGWSRLLPDDDEEAEVEADEDIGEDAREGNDEAPKDLVWKTYPNAKIIQSSSQSYTIMGWTTTRRYTSGSDMIEIEEKGPDGIAGVWCSRRSQKIEAQERTET